jgi:hypothetical protein
LGLFVFAFSLCLGWQTQESHQSLYIFAAFVQCGFSTQHGFELFLDKGKNVPAFILLEGYGHTLYHTKTNAMKQAYTDMTTP